MSPGPIPAKTQVKANKTRPFWRTRTLRYSVITASALASVLLFLLASATGNTPFLDRHYTTLLALNIGVALAMLLVVGVLVLRLAKRHRAGQFGTRLMARFALAFALMGVLPGALIYVVSVQFLSRSIESWFDLRVDKALEAGLALGRATLDSMLSDLNGKARNMANELADLSDLQRSTALARLAEQNGIEHAQLFTASGRTMATAGSIGSMDVSLLKLAPDLPPSSVLQQLRARRSYAAVESAQTEVDSKGDPKSDPKVSNGETNSVAAVAANGLHLRVIVPVSNRNLNLDTDVLYLQLFQAVPPALASNAEEVQNGARDYQELSLSRTGLQRIYGITLTLTLLLAIFAALAAAFLLATWLTRPLLQLAAGTIAVASGDYRPMADSHERDELGTLTQSFNTMTRQLDEARRAVEDNRRQLENANTYLESILGNMSAGVLVLDQGFHIVTANQAADRILERVLAQHLGQHLADVTGLTAFDASIERAFAEQTEMGGDQDWQQQIVLPRPGAIQESQPMPTAHSGDAAEPLTLLVRGSRCPVPGRADDVNPTGNTIANTAGMGYLIVFDDVSEVISAQRSVAWSEVARRLAHEIKNPLTPIQLSAERLQMKLHDRLTAPDAAVLERGVSTIVNQVNAMKHMVDDFRDYAKIPTADLTPIDLNALINEVMMLYGAGAEATAPATENSPGIVLQLADDLPTILGNATRLRQVLHNLVQNAQDASRDVVKDQFQDKPQDKPRPQVLVLTERVGPGLHLNSSVLRNPRALMVRLTISDNGCGFPAKILNRVFEPYVTTKVRGTGLGLAVVKKIADEHQARIEVRNRPEGGASVTLLFTRMAGEQLRVA